MPGEDARVERLRGLVKGFGALPGQRLTNALLRSELQRHVGGVAHLPPEFRRKRADQQHFITGQPKREVLLAAWEAFINVPDGGADKFDPDSVYADWQLQGANRGRPAASAAAALADADSVHESGRGAPAHIGQTSMEPWMQGVWVNLVDLKLARWKRHNAPSVLLMLRHQRTVAGAHLSTSAQFRDDVAQLMQSAVSLLFARHNRNELFNCMPAQIVAAMPDEFAHFGLLETDHECDNTCGHDGAMPTCRAVALEWARGALHSRRMAVLTATYEREGFRCAVSPLESKFWWWTAGPFVNELGRLHKRVAASLGIDAALFDEHIAQTMTPTELTVIQDAVRRGVRLQVATDGEHAFPTTEPAQQGEIARPARRKRSAADSEVLLSRVEKIMDDGWLGQAGLPRLPRVDETGHLLAYTDAARTFVARVSGFLHAHPREWAELWHNVRAKKRHRARAQEGCDSDEQIQTSWDSYWSDRQQNAECEV